MVSLTLRNIPEELLKRIKIFALRARRSLNSEMLIVIEEGLAQRISIDSTNSIPLISNAGREKMWTELCGTWIDEQPISEIITEIYDMRGLEKGGRE